MANVLTEPEAAKAATLTPEGQMAFYSFPIEKVEDGPDGEITVVGKATDGTLDSDLQIVDPAWSESALKEWFATGGNIRVQHQAQRDPAGKGTHVDGHRIRARVVEPVAVKLVKAGVLQDFSVGIMNPDVRSNRDPQFRHLPDVDKAVNGVITGRQDHLSKIGEVSLVDRGSNFGTKFAMLKAAANGAPEWVGQLTAPDEVLAKANGSGLTNVDLPSDMKLKVTPAVLAKMATLKRELVIREQAQKAAAPAAITITKGVTSEEELPSFKAAMAAEAAVYKRDIDTATRRRLASEGKALPNLSYPIETAGDLENAATLQRSGHGDVKGAARLIARRAKDLGVPNPLKEKPKKSPAMKAAEADDKLGQCPTCKGRGFTKKPANQKCEACGGSGRASVKAATPDAVKCMKCDDAGMIDGKPCPECKPSKAAEPAVGKKKGKMRALCPNCGAKQNPAHVHCPECGKPLPAAALRVKKNHNFVCLGCGADLDKGERHCAHCGKENPGYLPEADRKIPANIEADKSAGKDRVAKAKSKSGKKGQPFGGNQAKPFGAADEKEPGEAKPDKDAKAKPPKAEKRRKGKGKGRSPAAGVTGHETMGLPEHREPDGPAVEEFEHDTNLTDGNEGMEMRAAMRHKSLGIEPQLAVLHDLTCPAFAPGDVTKAFPHASFHGIDTGYWEKAALDAAAGSDMAVALERYNAAQKLSKAAVTLKTADAQVLHHLRMTNHAAFLEANKDLIKTFRDATPGPGSAPTPGHVMPQSFRRPYISAGHAAESPQAEGARTFPVISDHPQAQDFQRGYLSAGHASESPDNRDGVAPVPGGDAGRPEAVSYSGMQERDYEQAARPCTTTYPASPPACAPCHRKSAPGRSPRRTPSPKRSAARSRTSAKASKPTRPPRGRR